MKTMTRGLALSTLALLVALATAPDAPAQTLPEGWTAVADSGGADSIDFQAMAPGWHLYPGPAALIYRPGTTVEPPFRVEMEAYRFPGGTSGYGVFVGGRSLEPETYDFFEILLDGEGRYRLGHRAGATYHEIVPWTAHASIVAPTSEEAGHNVLIVEATGDRLTVAVNGTELTSFAPPSYARFDGVVGLRVLDGANVHVTRLDVSPIEGVAEDASGR